MEDGLINMEDLIEVGDKVFVITPNDTVHSYTLFYFFLIMWFLVEFLNFPGAKVMKVDA